MSKKQYTVEPNYCNCHPETCCCDDYTIDKDGKRFIRIHDKKKADYVCAALNAYEEEKK